MIEVIYISIKITCILNNIYSNIKYHILIKDNYTTIIDKYINNKEAINIELQKNKLYSLNITPSIQVYPYYINDIINTNKDTKEIIYNFGAVKQNKSPSIILKILDKNY